MRWRVFFLAVAAILALRAAPYIWAFGRGAFHRLDGNIGAPARDQEILTGVEKSRMLYTYARYRRLSALIEEARSRGSAVDGLQARADEALRLAQSGFRREADETLSRIELSVPRPKVQYVPLYKPSSESVKPAKVNGGGRHKKRKSRRG